MLVSMLLNSQSNIVWLTAQMAPMNKTENWQPVKNQHKNKQSLKTDENQTYLEHHNVIYLPVILLNNSYLRWCCSLF